jgi:uncharacterized protein YdeI (YjbR/CyaY-like superfamily)
MNANELDTYYPSSRKDWRDWLAEHHQVKHHIWLVMDKASSQKPNLSWSDAVDEALCFGWIDSKKLRIDDQRYMQYYTKRKPNSIWSKVNKQKVVELIENNLMTEAGHKSIEIAKENGSWTKHDAVESLNVPPDLQAAFTGNQEAEAYYQGLSNSLKKGLLYWVVSAKRDVTRLNRIDEIIGNAMEGKLPKQFR